jgi:D-amino peptidase
LRRWQAIIKIYIHTDFEGISGICNPSMMQKGRRKYCYAVKRLMDDVNAAVEGLFDGGAGSVTVLDSHGGGGNFDLSLLDQHADIDTRENSRWWGKLDCSYSGTCFIGAHAMAGTLDGFMEHTQSSCSWFNYRVNGCRIGELAQWAMVAAHFSVPLIMMSGDEAACIEAQSFLKKVECAAVKKGVGRNRAIPINDSAARELIYNAARKAVSNIDNAELFTPMLPINVELELCRSDFCDKIARSPGVERVDARTVRKVCDSYLDCLFI